LPAGTGGFASPSTPFGPVGQGSGIRVAPFAQGSGTR
jgi:hypothetical protein